ncbi:glycosyltransferase domain-containing protein [Streptomyces sp. SBT349]|uniref:glycosyltransferase domain-containing protein n=1 Tax=Streptomyces sp. SBT349 TaxID=1580539 RepID=UPI00066C4459|nr:glycosyltransferase domain-containing protein [Streptomyces sp. SBT349]
MQVITIATDLKNPFLERLLIPSCNAVGLDLVVLHSEKKDFTYMDKRTILRDYLARYCDGDDLILFTDAYDTLFIRGESYIREAYARLSRKVIFSAEPSSWPLGPVGYLLQGGPPVHPYAYLNSGGLMGPARDLLDLGARYPKPPSDQFQVLRDLRMHDYDTDERFAYSDQYYWTLVQLLESDTIGLDHEATIFQHFGPPVSELTTLEIANSIFDFRAHGRDAASYEQERARLQERLRSPSGAAQLHFANPINKAVVLDLLAEGQLPPWLRGSIEGEHSDDSDDRVRVHRVTR